jgi:hypothetical protein
MRWFAPESAVSAYLYDLITFLSFISIHQWGMNPAKSGHISHGSP